MIFIVAFYPFHLISHNNITHGLGKKYSKSIHTHHTIYKVTQRANIQGTSSDEPRVMVLMLEPLSKNAQLLSPLILTQATFSGPLQWVSRSGAIWNVFMLGETHPVVPAEQLLTPEGPTSLLCHPSFRSKLTFGQFCPGALDNLSPYDLDYLQLKQF